MGKLTDKIKAKWAAFDTKAKVITGIVVLVILVILFNVFFNRT